MNTAELDDTGHQFLTQLYDQVNGDPAVQASMYEIGESLGLDRDAASRVAEELIGLQLVEIRTLSGGISISTQGADKVQRLIAGADAGSKTGTKLGDGPVLAENECHAVNEMTQELKRRIGSLGLGFDSLGDLMADLKTIDAQLGSSHPKTGIIRECFRSIKTGLEKIGENELLGKVSGFLGE